MMSSSLCELLRWDTDFFGYRIGRVNTRSLTHQQAQHVDNWAIANRIDCVYFLSNYDVNNIRIAQQFNYELQDTPITLSRKLPNQPLPPPKMNELIIDTATATDLPSLLSMIDDLFTYTRFRNDPKFTQEQTDDLYQTWVSRSVREAYADRVFVIRRDTHPIGFLICKLRREEQVGNISLIGIARSEQKSNLGSALMTIGLNYFIEEQMAYSDVVTQAQNIASQRTFQKYGYRTSHVGLWYHKWFPR